VPFGLHRSSSGCCSRGSSPYEEFAGNNWAFRNDDPKEIRATRCEQPPTCCIATINTSHLLLVFRPRNLMRHSYLFDATDASKDGSTESPLILGRASSGPVGTMIAVERDISVLRALSSRIEVCQVPRNVGTAESRDRNRPQPQQESSSAHGRGYLAVSVSCCFAFSVGSSFPLDKQYRYIFGGSGSMSSVYTTNLGVHRLNRTATATRCDRLIAI
jgi:hypothetical protein